MLATLNARQRPRSARIRRRHELAPEPDPVAVETTRATVVEVGEPFASADRAAAWLRGTGDREIAAGLAVVNRALYAYRLATADPYVPAVGRGDALAARVGYGVGEEVADGVWSQARELRSSGSSGRRRRMLPAHARFAALLAGRQPALACEEFALRARLDLDQARDRETALQTLAALDAALAELPADPAGPLLADRVAELRDLRAGVVAAAQATLRASVAPAEREAAAHALDRLEAALRARAAALAD